MVTEPPSNGEAIWGSCVPRGRGRFQLSVGKECPGKGRCVEWLGNYGDEVPDPHKRREEQKNGWTEAGALESCEMGVGEGQGRTTAFCLVIEFCFQV